MLHLTQGWRPAASDVRVALSDTSRMVAVIYFNCRGDYLRLNLETPGYHPVTCPAASTRPGDCALASVKSLHRVIDRPIMGFFLRIQNVECKHNTSRLHRSDRVKIPAWIPHHWG